MYARLKSNPLCAWLWEGKNPVDHEVRKFDDISVLIKSFTSVKTRDLCARAGKQEQPLEDVKVENGSADAHWRGAMDFLART